MFFIWNLKQKEHSPRNSDLFRTFSKVVKQQCWEMAPIIEGRDPERWRYDAVGNAVCKKLTGCEGCLCFEYDHVKPFSKGGKSKLDNCQILQTRINRLKGCNESISTNQLKALGCSKSFSGISFFQDLLCFRCRIGFN